VHGANPVKENEPAEQGTWIKIIDNFVFGERRLIRNKTQIGGTNMKLNKRIQKQELLLLT